MYHPYYSGSWALVIGINDYRRVSPLSYACSDADAVARALIEQLHFPEGNVELLKDGAATRQGIERAYLSFSEKAGNPDDRCVVFFAGHGHTQTGNRGRIGYLIPADGTPEDLSTLIRWDFFTRNAELIPAKHILFIMDACYSGLAVQRAVTPGAQRFVSDLLQRPCRQVITAGKHDQTVADSGGPGGRNSIFTGYLIEGLKGAAVDDRGLLTANGLMYYVTRQVGQDDRSQQTPHYGNIEGDGDFIAYLPGGVSPDKGAMAELLVRPIPASPAITDWTPAPAGQPGYAEKSGYGDPTDPSFGRNDLSARLCEEEDRAAMPSERTQSRAFSWLSLIMEPYAPIGDSLDPLKLRDWLGSRGPGPAPSERFAVPTMSLTTLDSLVLYTPYSHQQQAPCWQRYMRITQSGEIEYADVANVFGEYEGFRYFHYVAVVGLAWQFLSLARDILAQADYSAGVRFLFSLVGTYGTRLADYAAERGVKGRTWHQPTDPNWSWHVSRPEECLNRNIQLEFRPALSLLDESTTKQIIVHVAQKLGQAYNHQGDLRCFNYGTEDFPWRQYSSYMRTY